jgi:hypothetical protein
MARPEKKSDHSSPFERFQKLTKDLLSVPREELQKKLDKYEREKHKRKKRG